MGLGSTACPGQREEVCAPRGFLEKSLSKKSAEENMVWDYYVWVCGSRYRLVTVKCGNACRGCVRRVTYALVTRHIELKKICARQAVGTGARNVFYLLVLLRPRLRTYEPNTCKGALQAAA